MRSVIDQFENYAKLNKRLPPETGIQLAEIEEPSALADAVASNLSIKVADKQALLGELNPARRLEMVFAFMEGELGVLQVEKKIRSRVKRQMEKTQREYYLNEQLKAIQRELGNEGEEGGDELAGAGREDPQDARCRKEARNRANAELKKLRAMAPMSAEATVARNYLDVLLGLPWGKKSKLKKDIAEAQRVLDEDHYGLEKVKDRIVEYLAVQARTNKLKGPILCLVGPPGVGKTSLGRSIARATGREFVRQSLGGVRDEAEIRGHRRTYIGSLPGKIISNIKKAGTSNPLFLLDEIDKLGQDFRGDPSSALLEVLDPEQNNRFQDHYLELDYDLVGRDVRHHRELARHAAAAAGPDGDHPARRLYRGREGRDRQAPPDPQADGGARPEARASWCSPTRRCARSIQHYTREAGVRTLERELAKVARKSLRQILEGKAEKVELTRRQSRRLPRRPQIPLRHGRGRGPDRRRHRPRLDRGRRRAADDRGGDRSRQGPDQDHRQARRSDAGIDPGGDELRQGARAGAMASSRRSSRARTSTSTCPKARCPRTGRRRASAWSRR